MRPIEFCHPDNNSKTRLELSNSFENSWSSNLKEIISENGAQGRDEQTGPDLGVQTSSGFPAVPGSSALCGLRHHAEGAPERREQVLDPQKAKGEIGKPWIGQAVVYTRVSQPVGRGPLVELLLEGRQTFLILFQFIIVYTMS